MTDIDSAAEQRDELVAILRELALDALRLKQLMHLTDRKPCASVADWNAARQALDNYLMKAGALLAKIGTEPVPSQRRSSATGG